MISGTAQKVDDHLQDAAATSGAAQSAPVEAADGVMSDAGHAIDDGGLLAKGLVRGLRYPQS
jgi:hypothetical protein